MLMIGKHRHGRKWILAAACVGWVSREVWALIAETFTVRTVEAGLTYVVVVHDEGLGH